jgi:hypothetical protein
MSINIPLMVSDHGQPEIEALDAEISRLVERIADLSHRRSLIHTHVKVQQAFALEPVSSSHTFVGVLEHDVQT